MANIFENVYIMGTLWYLCGLVTIIGIWNYTLYRYGMRWRWRDVPFCIIMGLFGPIMLAAILGALIYRVRQLPFWNKTISGKSLWR